MGRSSETRSRVRALAVVWTQEGRELSPKAVLAELGGGSLTTIVDELRKFREDRIAEEQSDPGRAAAMAAIGELGELAGPPSPNPEPLPPEAATGPGAASDSPQTANALLALSGQLEKALARFDAMQRRMHKEVDEAREAARYWKDVAERARADVRAELEGYRNSMQREAERANVLQGRLDQLLTNRPT